MPEIMVAIQARMGSTRLPGKVLKPIGKKPALAHTIDRVRLTGYKYVLTIPTGVENDVLYNWALDYDVPVHRGPHPDVLLAMANACAWVGGADYVVRVTGDCPFVTIDIPKGYLFRYMSNAHPVRRVFKGGDWEIFDWDLLQEAVESARDTSDREHVTPWMRRRLGLGTSSDDGPFRCVLDTPEDYDLLQRIAADLDLTAPHPTPDELAAWFQSNAPAMRSSSASSR